MPANFVLWNVRDAAELAYWFGQRPGARAWSARAGRMRRCRCSRPTMTARRSLFAADALLPDGWARNVLLAWDAAGRLTAGRSRCHAPRQASPGPTAR